MFFTENIQGPFAVTFKCIGCDICAAIAPNNFAANTDATIEYGYCYVIKQPHSAHERSLCLEAAEICPADAITTDRSNRLDGGNQ